jgi:hypothetical protein
MSSKKLPPIDLKEDNEKFEAHHESKEITFGRCTHKNAHFQNGMLVCPCGSAWSGNRLDELFDLFTKKK